MAKEKNKTELPEIVEGELQARLIKLREDAGFDVSQMADALCLSEDVIVNLENEAFDLLAEPPYVRGYLRNYAKLGNDDPTELINRYEALRGADAAELDYQIKASTTITTAPQKRMSFIWSQLLLLGVLVGAIALVWSIPGVNSWISEKWTNLSSQLTPSDASNNPSLLGDLPVPAPLPEESTTDTLQSTDAPATTTNNEENTTNNEQATTSQDTSSEKTESADTTNTTTEETTSTDTQTNTEKQENSPADTTQEVVSTSVEGTINIKLVFNKEVWLRIKDGENKTVFEGLNKAETEKTLDFKKPLTFRVGNAQGLSLFIDNKAVDITSYINGSIANFTLE